MKAKQSDAPDWRCRKCWRGCAPVRSAIGLIGIPAQLVDGLRKLAKIGLDGAAVSWIDYDEGIKHYQGRAASAAAGSGIAGLNR